mmetsp:Transcript_53950/g.107071  ORF Transcript_53950/g.107071 Transcript_53950/m.107071 type:complete len:251 (-) Transcript_53950:85-837(-)
MQQPRIRGGDEVQRRFLPFNLQQSAVQARKRFEIGVRVEARQVVGVVLEAPRQHALRGRAWRGVLAREEPSSQRVVGHKLDTGELEERQQLLLRAAVERVVEPLVHRRGGPPVGRTQVQRTRHLGHVVVAHAHGAHKPFLHQRVHSLQTLKQVRLRVWLMQIELIDLRAPKSCERVTQLRSNSFSRQAARLRRVSFGCDTQHFGSHRCQARTHNRLRFSTTVNSSTIESVNAGVKSTAAHNRSHIIVDKR